MNRFSAPHSVRLTSLEGAPLAPFRARAAAFLADLLLVIIASALFTLPAAVSQFVNRSGPRVFIQVGDFWVVGVGIAYFTLATYWGNGQTIGKRLFRIRVISLVHDRLDLWPSLERALGYAASSLEAGFGFFQYFIHPNRQTVHDRIAETIVVRADWNREQ